MPKIRQIGRMVAKRDICKKKLTFISFSELTGKLIQHSNRTGSLEKKTEFKRLACTLSIKIESTRSKKFERRTMTNFNHPFQTDRGRKSSSNIKISVGANNSNSGNIDLGSLLGGLGVNLGSSSVRNVDKRIVNLPDGSQEIVTTTRDADGRETRTVERVNRSGNAAASSSGLSRSSGVDSETSAKISSILSQFMK